MIHRVSTSNLFVSIADKKNNKREGKASSNFYQLIETCFFTFFFIFCWFISILSFFICLFKFYYSVTTVLFLFLLFLLE